MWVVSPNRDLRANHKLLTTFTKLSEKLEAYYHPPPRSYALKLIIIFIIFIIIIIILSGMCL
jgi:hypothetical protein